VISEEDSEKQGVFWWWFLFDGNKLKIS